jgi:hypothetical protein
MWKGFKSSADGAELVPDLLSMGEASLGYPVHHAMNRLDHQAQSSAVAHLVERCWPE